MYQAKAEDLDFGRKNQGQWLTSLTEITSDAKKDISCTSRH